MADSYNFMAGAYQVQFGFAGDPVGTQVDIGKTEVGFEVITRPSSSVLRFDNTGRTPVDGLVSGVEDLIIRIQCSEWSRVVWQSVLKYAMSGASEGAVVEPGNFVCNATSGLASRLVLTPLTGLAKADADGGGTYTYLKAFPFEPIRTMFSAQRLRSHNLAFYVFGNSVTDSVASMYSVVYT